MGIRVSTGSGSNRGPAIYRMLLLICFAMVVLGCGDSGAASDAGDASKALVIPAEIQTEPSAERVEELVGLGRAAFAEKGCIACHMITGERLTGPGLANIFGQPIKLVDGTEVQRDLVYLYKSIVVPNQYVSQSGPIVMPPYAYLDEQTLIGLTYFVRSLTETSPGPSEQPAESSDE